MKNYSKEDIDFIIREFNNTTLSKSRWNHEAHIIIALWHNTVYDFEIALELVRSKIKAYNEIVGTPNTEASGYHETLTVFWMIFTKNYLLKNSFEELHATINFFLKEHADKAIPLDYYSEDILFSKEARRIWINGNLKEMILYSDKT